MTSLDELASADLGTLSDDQLADHVRDLYELRQDIPTWHADHRPLIEVMGRAIRAANSRGLDFEQVIGTSKGSPGTVTAVYP